MNRYPYAVSFAEPTVDGRVGLLVTSPTQVTYMSPALQGLVAGSVPTLSERSAAARCRRDMDARSTGAVTYMTLTDEEAAIVL